MTASMLAPIAQRSGAPVLIINLQPTEVMNHAEFTTGPWLAYCGACPLPEIANTFLRLDIPFRSVSGYVEDERAWARIAAWIAAAGIRATLRHGRHGLMGHLYPGMLDVSTDLTLVTANFGGHVEVLEFDDLRVRVDRVTDAETDARMALTREIFDVDDTVQDDDFRWGAKVSVGLDRLVDDFGLDSLAYYHRGLEGEQHERLGAGMILGASLLTARGIPAVGEYELRTSLAMLIVDRLGAGGSFTEFQALNFRDDVVEMGHDGPAHLAISDARPLLRGLGVFHGKRGWGVSVEFEVKHGPVTTVGVRQGRDGRYALVASEGTVVDGPSPGHRQHHVAGRLRLRSRRMVRRLERHRDLPPLGLGRRPPDAPTARHRGPARRRAGRSGPALLTVTNVEQKANHHGSSDAVKEVLGRQAIELPSWAFGNSGTRFKVFAQAGGAAGSVREDGGCGAGAGVHRGGAVGGAAHPVGQGRRLREAGARRRPTPGCGWAR